MFTKTRKPSVELEPSGLANPGGRRDAKLADPETVPNEADSKIRGPNLDPN